ncbi:hypothetical protein EJB05_37744 [Eragrostis curvula]|uniref:Uncharacterized protein n=1 Tax=Eragrostis curvula TaxID=38414 RepID=A0A5J9TSF8_9POAL|nr:hypothetical protein EJB05_37744 [Eragrostis curvula]
MPSSRSEGRRTARPTTTAARPHPGELPLISFIGSLPRDGSNEAAATQKHFNIRLMSRFSPRLIAMVLRREASAMDKISKSFAKIDEAKQGVICQRDVKSSKAALFLKRKKQHRRGKQHQTLEAYNKIECFSALDIKLILSFHPCLEKQHTCDIKLSSLTQEAADHDAATKAITAIEAWHHTRFNDFNYCLKESNYRQKQIFDQKRNMMTSAIKTASNE